MCGQYYGIKLDPIPDHPTKEQALKALSMLTGSLRWEYYSYYSRIVKNYINHSKECEKDE